MSMKTMDGRKALPLQMNFCDHCDYSKTSKKQPDIVKNLFKYRKVRYKAFADPNGNASMFTYDALGLLVKAEDAAGGYKELIPADGNTKTVSLRTAMGRTTVMSVSGRLQNASVREVIAPDGTKTTTEFRGDALRRRYGNVDNIVCLQLFRLASNLIIYPGKLSIFLTSSPLSQPRNVWHGYAPVWYRNNRR